MLSLIFKKFSHAHLDSVFDRNYDCINRQSTKEYACIDFTSMVVLVVYVNVIINIQTKNYRVLISSKVVTCSSVKTFALQFLQKNQALSKSERFELVNNASKKRWVGYVHVLQ